MFQISVLLVKPDGVEKNLVGEIRDIILSRDLRILFEEGRMLSYKEADYLYREFSARDYYPELIAFMSSAPVHYFVVSGEEAIKTIRLIIGKRDPASGIRARWSESIIRNVAHGPHAVDEAIELINILTKKEFLMKKIFFIGGMSECGKSTLGKYLDSKGVKRLKIVSFLKKIKEREGDTTDFYEWNDRVSHERGEWIREEFSKEFIPWALREGIECCCFESLYEPRLALHLQEKLGKDVVHIVYVDIPQDVRIQRQMIRENLTSELEARDMLIPRDENKTRWGVPTILDYADIVIDNSGTIKDLEREGDKLIAMCS